MARYIGPVCRLCRREAMKLFLKGERCYTEKCAIEKRNFPPGQHGKTRKAKIAGYGLQLREKQKVKRIYGVLEDQFRRYFEAAERTRGITGETLLQLLERRLDNVIYRLGLSTSRPQARQLVRHGHFLVNGKKVDIPSYSVKPGRRDHRPRTEPEERHHRARDRRSEGPRHPRMALVRRRVAQRPHRVDADARADQSARAGTADRRVVFEIGSRLWALGFGTNVLAKAQGLKPKVNTRVEHSLPSTRSLIQTCGGRSTVTCRSGGPSAGPLAKGSPHMLWKGFQRPKRLEFERETLTDRFGRFYAQPFERGFGTTIGNALRRVLLSSIEGAAITAVKIDGVLHEFSPIPGVVEDATDIILNLKQIPLKLHTDHTKTLVIRVDKPGEVRARDIQTDGDVEILEPDAHIATVAEHGKLHMEMRMKRGRGYVAADKNFDEDLGIGWIPIDSVHSPIKKVNYLVEAARLGQTTDYDKLTVDVWTNGSISARDAVSLSAKLIRDHLNIFINLEEGAEPQGELRRRSAAHRHRQREPRQVGRGARALGSFV